MTLYEIAMQIVPVMLIALFLDNRDDTAHLTGFRGWWQRMESKMTSVLSAAAFFVSMFVVAGSVEPSRFTQAVVIAALSGSLMLLYSQSARSIRRPRRRPEPSGTAAPHAGR